MRVYVVDEGAVDDGEGSFMVEDFRREIRILRYVEDCEDCGDKGLVS